MGSRDTRAGLRVEGREEAADEGRAEDVRVVLITAPNAETGEVLAREMVEERLAACGSVVPGLVSVYWWEDEVQRDKEALVILKTTRDAVPLLEERVTDLHPYEVPEFLVLRVDAVHEPYARWIGIETRPEGATGE